jgi:flagellar biosynthetic protein FliQ
MPECASPPGGFYLIAAVGASSLETASQVAQRALVIAMELALPVLAVGLAVGLIVSLVQAVTQIQEQTLSFIPKILAMAATLFILTPWFLSVLSAYMKEVLGGLERFGLP